MINVAFSLLTEELSEEQIASFRAELDEKWPWEMTPVERARSERKKIAMRTGAIAGQKQLLGHMKKGQAQRR